MARLPLLISVPHAGLEVPPELEPYHILTPAQIAHDGDEGAAAIYALCDDTAAFLTTSIARAFIDLNRPLDDRSKDGVVKTHTCWDEPIYSPTPPDTLFAELLDRHHRPYHERLVELATTAGVRLGVDCHTMAAVAPPVAPDPGRPRPWVCLSHAGWTCPDDWLEMLRTCFAQRFDGNVRLNDPFRGGYITRTHATELPWVQLELSREPFDSDSGKRARVFAALEAFATRAAL